MDTRKPVTNFSPLLSGAKLTIYSAKLQTRLIPVLLLEEAKRAKTLLLNEKKIFLRQQIAIDQSNKSLNSTCLFAIRIEEKYIWPIFNTGDLAIVDTEVLPKPDDYLLIYFPALQKTMISKYRETHDCLFPLLNNNYNPIINLKNPHEATIIGVICELRKYF